MIASRCPHCGVPHEPPVTVCPTTGLAMPRLPAGRGAGIPPAPAVPQRPRPEEAASPAAEQAPKRRQLIGRVIGDKYGVTGMIGEGGMGAVYEAEHLAIGRLVAVKVLHPKHAQKREAISRLQHEARVVGTIGHPNICEVYDMGHLDDGSPYLVMERLHGETLAERIQRQGAVPYPELIDIMVQVLSALGAAHAKGIIHRDLKPDNIFLAQPPSGGASVAKLLDFGISKAQAMEESSMRLTRTGMVMGTPYYMAPEQARGERALDQRVDLWAVGVLIYEALSGRRPFLARNYNALLVQILTSRHRPLTEVVPGVPAGLSLLVDKALSKMREDRFQNATEFQEALIRVRAPQSGGTVVLYGRRAGDRKDGPPSTERVPGQSGHPSAPPQPQAIQPGIAGMSQPQAAVVQQAMHPSVMPQPVMQPGVMAPQPMHQPEMMAQHAPQPAHGHAEYAPVPVEPAAASRAGAAAEVPSSRPARAPMSAPASSAPVGRIARDGRRGGRSASSGGRSGSPPASVPSALRPVSSPPRPASSPPRPVSSPPRPSSSPALPGPRGAAQRDTPRQVRASKEDDPTQPRIVVPRAPPIDPASISESLSGESGEAELRVVEDPTFVLPRGLTGEVTHRDSTPPSPDDDAPTYVQSVFQEEDAERTVVDPPSFSTLTGRAQDLDAEPPEGLTPVRRAPTPPPSDGQTPVRRAPTARGSEPKTQRSESAGGSRKKKKK